MKTQAKPAGVAAAMAALSLEKFATSHRADFRFAPLNALLMVGIFVTGLIVHLAMYPFTADAVFLSLGSALVLALLLRLTQVWEVMVILGAAD